MQFLERQLRQGLDRGAEFLARRTIDSAFERTSSATRAGRLQLFIAYRMAALAGQPLPPVHECGLRVFSRTEEDGLLLRIFGEVGSGPQTFIEFGCADGLETIPPICASISAGTACWWTATPSRSPAPASSMNAPGMPPVGCIVPGLNAEW